jgi:NTP pyrophosphatase (non-canonical NTP hydrolase)
MDTKQLNDQTARLIELREKIKEFQSKRGWGSESPKDIALSLILEASELLEHFQFKSGKEVLEEARLYGPICDELADVLWWVLSMANRLDIDVTRALLMKMEKNEKKYPPELFTGDMTDEEKRKHYYAIKAKYRGGHPLAEKND